MAILCIYRFLRLHFICSRYIGITFLWFQLRIFWPYKFLALMTLYLALPVAASLIPKCIFEVLGERLEWIEFPDSDWFTKFFQKSGSTKEDAKQGHARWFGRLSMELFFLDQPLSKSHLRIYSVVVAVYPRSLRAYRKKKTSPDCLKIRRNCINTFDFSISIHIIILQ